MLRRPSVDDSDAKGLYCMSNGFRSFSWPPTEVSAPQSRRGCSEDDGACSGRMGAARTVRHDNQSTMRGSRARCGPRRATVSNGRVAHRRLLLCADVWIGKTAIEVKIYEKVCGDGDCSATSTYRADAYEAARQLQPRTRNGLRTLTTVKIY